jgi:ribonuclease BN (tRNA processing enzyme)
MSKLIIKFLGSGSAFVLAEENYQSNILITKSQEEFNVSPASLGGPTVLVGENKPHHLLYDAGSTISEALNSAELEPKDLDSLFISHLHDDHAGGVEYLAFKTYFGQFPFGEEKIKLYSHETVLREGWDDCWKAGLQSIQGQVNTLENYFDCNYLNNNDSFDFYGTEIQPVQTVHVVDNRRFVPSYGLMINEGEMKIFISGDSNPFQ